MRRFGSCCAAAARSSLETRTPGTLRATITATAMPAPSISDTNPSMLRPRV